MNMTDENLDDIEKNIIEESSPRNRPLPYAQDKDYKELLVQFQNGDWSASAILIDKLLANYSDDPGLLEFQNEVEVKRLLQQSSEVSQKEDRRKAYVKLGTRVGIGALALIALLSIAFFAFNSYQSGVVAMRETQQAETLYLSLSTKLQNARDLIRSGRPAGALSLLQEIEDLDPGFEGLAEARQEAESAVELDALYEKANQYYSEGLLEEALEVYQEIENENPSFRNTRFQINQVEEELEIVRLLEEISVSYDQQGWDEVVDAYQRIIDLNPATDIDSVREKLFTSYMNLIIETADKLDSTLEDIDKAQEYYKAALALFPQDREFASERAELQKLATRLISNNYYIFAMDLLETEGYGPGTVREVIRLLGMANNIGDGSPAIEQEIQRATLFVNAFDKLASSSLDGAINDLELLYRQQPDYGDGLVQYLLFEAYLARGDVQFTYADYQSARSDYELAETFAWGDHGNTLRLFEVEVRIGYSLRRLGLLDQASEYYNYALKLVSFREKVMASGEIDQIENYEAALDALAARDEWNAARLFEVVLEDISVIYTIEEIEVTRGQSIYMLAFNTGSTVSAIREINDLGLVTSFRYDQNLALPLFVEGE